MPYLSEKIKIEGTKFDRRRKLTEEDKKKIRELSSAGISQRRLASIYKVDRRLISFILNPSALEENLKRREERGGSKIYYDKKKHAVYVKLHRRYKQDLKLKEEIK